MSYQLKKDVKPDFPFAIDDNKYKMRYLNGPDRKKVAELTLEGQKLERKAKELQGDEAALESLRKDAEKLTKEMSDIFNSLITAQDEQTRPISEVLEEETAPVLRHFQEMVQFEQSLEYQPKVKLSFE